MSSAETLSRNGNVLPVPNRGKLILGTVLAGVVGAATVLLGNHHNDGETDSPNSASASVSATVNGYFRNFGRRVQTYVNDNLNNAGIPKEVQQSATEENAKVDELANLLKSPQANQILQTMQWDGGYSIEYVISVSRSGDPTVKFTIGNDPLVPSLANLGKGMSDLADLVRSDQRSANTNFVLNLQGEIQGSNSTFDRAISSGSKVQINGQACTGINDALRSQFIVEHVEMLILPEDAEIVPPCYFLRVLTVNAALSEDALRTYLQARDEFATSTGKKLPPLIVNCFKDQKPNEKFEDVLIYSNQKLPQEL